MTPMNRLQEIEEIVREADKEVNAAEHTGLRARWASGHILLKGRQSAGGRLPKGTVKKLTVALSLHPSELTARMKFAEKFQTEEQLTNVISEFKTWFAIKQTALTDTPREKKLTHPLTRIIKLLEKVEADTLNRADLPLLSRIHDLVGQLEQALAREAA